MYAPTVRTRLDLANAWMGTFNHWDLSGMLSYMTEAQDFLYSYMPASLGMAPKSRREFLHYSTFMKNVIPNLEISVISVYDSASSMGPVVAHPRGEHNLNSENEVPKQDPKNSATLVHIKGAESNLGRFGQHTMFATKLQSIVAVDI
ncbi:hypothetical protein FIBSPDRAFT_1049458 [Athelia psychrophila]|uniref:Uncharacterized protein n=1 Tax=Athelia psychrophila TaxID=1759441 RepID=A0A166C5N4_9AGAM|nr:hypothetical protein FIBSPDRAFT_1049458 [Fibularhizoctonia sp. CBS 109695]